MFLVSEQGVTPNALLHNLKHNKVLHAHQPVRHGAPPRGAVDRASTGAAEIEALGHDCWQVTLHFGFKNEPDVPEALTLLAAAAA